jgi:hypothetical protein
MRIPKLFSAIQELSVPFTVYNYKFALIIKDLNCEIWVCQLSYGPESIIFPSPIYNMQIKE